VLAACGSSADPTPPPKPAPAVPPSLIAEAERLAATPEDWLELGKTYLVRGDAERAKVALARAKPEKLADEVAALELRALLGERVDFAPAIDRVAMRMEPPPGAFAAALDRAESLQGINAVAAGLLLERDFADDLDEVEPKLTPEKLDALLALAHGDRLLQLARIARHRHRPDAPALAARAAKEHPDRAAALELIFQGDKTTRLVPDDAELAALRGEPSKQLAAKELPKQSIDGEDVDPDDASGQTPAAEGQRGSIDATWAHLAVAAFARGEDGRAVIAQHPSLDTISTVAWTLAELGRFADAESIAHDDPRPRETIARIRIARGELAEAVALQPTFTDTLDALGRAGDTQRLAPLLRDRPPAIRAHALDLAARALAKRGDCSRAIDLARSVKQAACDAVVARSCPP